jgi:hypothetical protein
MQNLSLFTLVLFAGLALISSRLVAAADDVPPLRPRRS